MQSFRVMFLAFLLVATAVHQGTIVSSQETELREMKVKGVIMDPHGDTPMVLLEDTQAHHMLPIWIGLPEARAIALALENVPTPRPFTHVLLKNILATLHAEVVHIVIHDIQDNTFYALIALRTNQQMLSIDARPSDAIALALSTNAPIFVSPKVLGAVETIPPPPLSPAPTSTQALGMHMQNLDASLASFFHVASPDGVLVAFVETASEAERRGIRQGDIITSVNGTAVKNIQDVLTHLQEVKKDQEIVLQITRQTRLLTIRLAAVSPPP